MKQLYIFKHNAEAAALETGRAFVKSTCDVEKLDRGACDQADKILAKAMGETGCFRDKETGEVISAWWADEEDGNICFDFAEDVSVEEDELQAFVDLV